MYGFPSTDELRALEGAELVQICIGRNEIILNFFPESTSILVNSIEALLDNNSTVFYNINSMNRLLGGRIIRTSALGTHQLEIHFTNGGTLRLIDDSDQFESVVIRTAGRVIVA
jgi:hypothetical protein